MSITEKNLLDTKLVDESHNLGLSNNDTEDNAYVVYIVIDKILDGLGNYFSRFGIPVSKVFTSIDNAKDTILLQVNPYKVIIIDTGTGRFTNMVARKSLVDLMGIADETAIISVFYTDSVIKSEVEYSSTADNKSIKWYKYRSTPDVVARLLADKGNSTYILDSDYEPDRVITIDDLSKIKGARLSDREIGTIKETEYMMFNTSDYIKNMSEDNPEHTALDGYDIII